MVCAVSYNTAYKALLSLRQSWRNVSIGEIFKDQVLLASFPVSTVFICMGRLASCRMKSSNSPAEYRRLPDFVPSIRPSFLSVVLVFVCGCLWVKNETTNERLIALESRVNLFPFVQSVSTKNTDRISLLQPKGTARDLYKKVQTHISERIGYTPVKIIASDVI